MSDRITESYTLKNFTDLATETGDNEEIRIRKSNKQLTNTPLGIIARNFGSTHSDSNTAVTQAFIKTIQRNDKYHTIADKLAATLSTSMPQGQPLTPAKIKAAIQSADMLLKTHANAEELADICTKSYKLIPESMQNEFFSFTENYLTTHPEVKVDLISSFNDDNSNKEKILTGSDLKNMITGFYKNKNLKIEDSGLCAISPNKCGGNKQKAELITKLFVRNLEGMNKIEDLLPYEIKTNTKNSNSLLPKEYKNLLQDQFDKKIKILTADSKELIFDRLQNEDLKKIDQALQSNKNLSDSNKEKALQSIYRVIAGFCELHQVGANPSDSMKAELSKVVERCCEQVALGQSSTAPFMMAVKQYNVDRLLNTQALTENGKTLFAEFELNDNVGLAALNLPEVKKSLVSAVQALGQYTTPAEIKQAVIKGAREFLQQHNTSLKKINNLAPNLVNTAVKFTLPFVSAINGLKDNALQEIKSDKLSDILTDLDKMSTVLFDKNLSDSERSSLLTEVTSLILSDSSQEEQRSLLNANQKLFSKLLGQLQDMVVKKDLDSQTRGKCSRISTLLTALHSKMCQQLQLSDADTESLKLSPVKADGLNPAILNGIDPGKAINRNATAADLFVANQAIDAEKYLNAEDKETIKRLMKQLNCSDYKLIKELIRLNGYAPKLMFKSLTTQKGINSLYHAYKDVICSGHMVEHVVSKFPQYSRNELLNFCAEITLLTKEQDDTAQMLLENIKDPNFVNLMEVTYNLQQVEKYLDDKNYQSVLVNSTQMKETDSAFDLLEAYVKVAAKKLQVKAPDQIFNKKSPKTRHDLPFNHLLNPQLNDDFPKSFNYMDQILSALKTDLTPAQQDQVNDFYCKLKLPVGSNTLKHAGAYRYSTKFTVSFKDVNGEALEYEWNSKTLAYMLGFNAKPLSALLLRTGGNPSAVEVWKAVHGGEPPADLTMDNFAEKYMTAIIKEIHNYMVMIGDEDSIVPDTFISVSGETTGLSPQVLVKKMQNIAHEDVEINMKDQDGKEGFFSKIVCNTHGKDHYNFSADFTRAIMPPGSVKNNYHEGCKIVVKNPDGSEKVFVQREYVNTPDNQKDNYLNKIVDTVRPLCVSEAQLNAVGLCTTQAVQPALRQASNIYRNITCGAFEHTALDHQITKLDNGKIKVEVNEKPGTIFKFHVVCEVDSKGIITMPEGYIVLPSLDKINSYNQTQTDPKNMIK